MDSPHSDTPLLQALDRHEPDLRAYARALLPTWDAVDEVLQEASLVMWQKIDQLDSLDGFLPWAKVIVRFEALKLRRKYARDRHVFSNELIALLADDGEAEGSGEERRLEALEGCLEHLSPQNRELVFAPYLADQAVIQIAERSGRTVNSLYKLLGRLRSKLRDCVENQLTRLDGPGQRVIP